MFWFVVVVCYQHIFLKCLCTIYLEVRVMGVWDDRERERREKNIFTCLFTFTPHIYLRCLHLIWKCLCWKPTSASDLPSCLRSPMEVLDETPNPWIFSTPMGDLSSWLLTAAWPSPVFKGIQKVMEEHFLSLTLLPALCGSAVQTTKLNKLWKGGIREP